MNKKRKRLIIGLVLVLLAYFFGKQLVNGYVKNYFAQTIEELNTNNLRIAYNKIDVQLFNGVLKLSDFSLLETTSNQKDTVRNFSLDFLEVQGFNIWDFAKDKKLEFESIYLESPKVYLNLKALVTKKDTSTSSFDSISFRGIDVFSLDRVDLINPEILINPAIGKPKRTTAASVKLAGFTFEQDNASKGKFYINTDQIFLEVSNMRHQTAGMYNFSVAQLDIRFAKKVITVKNLSLQPKGDVQTLADTYTFNNEVYKTKIAQLKVSNIDFKTFVSSGALQVDSLAITGLELDIFKDKKKPYDYKKRAPKFTTALKNVEFPFTINTINISESALSYSEDFQDSSKNLKVAFSELSLNTGVIDNSGGPIAIDFYAHAQNKIPVSLDLEMSAHDSPLWFKMIGKVERGNFSDLNTLSDPGVGIRFDNGTINSIVFNAYGNAYKSDGELTLLYSNLDLVVNKENDTENKFLSFVGNTVVRADNPTDNGKTFIANMEAERVVYKSPINYVWKTIESGIINAVIPFGDRTNSKQEARKNKRD